MTTMTIKEKTPIIGQEWPEQGGIYAGSRIIEGAVHHLVIPGGNEHDIVDTEFRNAAEVVKAKGEINGHSDWRAPEQRDLMLAYINVPDLFERSGMASIYWTSSQFSEFLAWAVDFEYGFVHYWLKDSEFRVRPFRSVIDSSL